MTGAIDFFLDHKFVETRKRQVPERLTRDDIGEGRRHGISRLCVTGGRWQGSSSGSFFSVFFVPTVVKLFPASCEKKDLTRRTRRARRLLSRNSMGPLPTMFDNLPRCSILRRTESERGRCFGIRRAPIDSQGPVGSHRLDRLLSDLKASDKNPPQREPHRLCVFRPDISPLKNKQSFGSGQLFPVAIERIKHACLQLQGGSHMQNIQRTSAQLRCPPAGHLHGSVK